MPGKNSKGKRYVFTHFFEPADLNLAIKNFKDFFRQKGAKYVWGEETCPTTGKNHLQGYVEFTTDVRITRLHKLYPKTNIDIAKGNRKQNDDYCTKEGKNIVRVSFFIIPK